MSVTVFGIIWLSLMIYAFFRLKIKHFIFLTLFSMLFQCNNIFIIGTQGVGPQLVTSFCFIIKSYLGKYKHIQIRLTKHILRACCVFLLYIVIWGRWQKRMVILKRLRGILKKRTILTWQKIIMTGFITLQPILPICILKRLRQRLCPI